MFPLLIAQLTALLAIQLQQRNGAQSMELPLTLGVIGGPPTIILPLLQRIVWHGVGVGEGLLRKLFMEVFSAHGDDVCSSNKRNGRLSFPQ